MSGVAAQAPPCRTARAKARPSMSGISTSDTMTSTASPPSRKASAAAALPAAVTS